MVSYLGSLVQFSPAAGRAGRCRQIALCVDSTYHVPPHWVCPAHGCLCFPRLHCSGSQLLYMERALCWVRFEFSGPPQQRGFCCACVLCCVFPASAVQATRGLGALSPGAARLFPPRPQPDQTLYSTNIPS